MFKPILFSLALLIILFLSVPKKANATNTTLLQQLSTDYGLSGGDWLFYGDEEDNLSNLWLNNIDGQLVSVASMPFDTAIEIENSAIIPNVWEVNSGILNQTAIQTGDNILLTFWIKGIQAEQAHGLIGVSVEHLPTYTKSVFKEIVPTDEWQQFFVSFSAVQSSAINKTQLQFTFGNQLQTVQVAGLAVLNYEDSYALADLPETDFATYAGSSLSAAWRADAETRIERHRKGAMTVAVTDADGNALEGATVELNMKSHAFRFGTAVNSDLLLQNSADARTYRNKLLNLDGKGHGFNHAVIENGLKWPDWEGYGSTDRADTIASINWLQQKNIPIHGHVVVWGDWSFLPPDLVENQNDPVYLDRRVRSHIDDLMSHAVLKETVVDWDVVNEPIVNKAFANAFPTGSAVYADWYDYVAQKNPTADLFINENTILTSGGLNTQHQTLFHDLLAELQTANANVDGIGMQSHFDTILTPPERVYDILEAYSQYNHDLHISEFDIVGIDEQVAATYMRDFLTITFSHPQVSSFILWGFWDGSHWRDDAPLFKENWRLKPAGQTFVDLLFNQWWTNESGTLDSDGILASEGFYGIYDIVVTHNGQTQTFEVEHLTDSNAIHLTLKHQLYLPIIGKS